MATKPTFKSLRDLVQHMPRVVGDTTSFFPDKREVSTIKSLLLMSSRITETVNGSLTYDAMKIIGESERTTAKVLFRRTDGKWIFLTHNLFPSSLGIKISSFHDELPKVGEWKCLDEEGKTIRNRAEQKYGTWGWGVTA